MTTKKLKLFYCACCGSQTHGRQWWNRDTGFGLCLKCHDHISAKQGEEYTPEQIERTYGKKGYHCAID